MRDQDLNAIRREVRKLLEPIQLSIDTNASNIENLNQTVQQNAATGSFAEIVNILNNSHPEWSTAAYDATGVNPSDAGDTNLEAKNWYRQPVADTELVQSSANALKAAKTSEPADHTLWAANEGAAIDGAGDIPRWDKINGTIEFGGESFRYDLFIPLPNDVIFPGQIFYVQFEAMLRTATAMPSGLQAYCGLYDNTAGQRKYIEGGTFTITDDQGNDPGVTYGTPGSTSVDYKVVAYTDSGEQAISNTLNFPNAPAVFDGNNHPRVKFAGVPGFIRFEIYRRIGTEYVLQYTVGNTIEGVYYDVGNPPQQIVSAFPVITTTKPKAYAVTRTFQPGSLTGLGWVRHAMTIFVPTTYDRSVTGTGMQYFRFGFNALTTDARQVLLRRFGLSMGSGKWARSPEDVRPGVHSTPSSTATGAGSSGTGGVEPPPGGGSGGPECVLLDTPLELKDGPKELKDVKRGEFTRNGGPVCGQVRYVKQFQTSRIYWVETESGLARGCTFDHPHITGDTDFNGTPCEALKKRFDKGEVVTTMTVNSPTDRIVKIEERVGDFWVGIPVVDGPHIIILGGFYDHNLKIVS